MSWGHPHWDCLLHQPGAGRAGPSLPWHGNRHAWHPLMRYERGIRRLSRVWRDMPCFLRSLSSFLLMPSPSSLNIRKRLVDVVSRTTVCPLRNILPYGSQLCGGRARVSIDKHVPRRRGQTAARCQARTGRSDANSMIPSWIATSERFHASVVWSCTLR